MAVDIESIDFYFRANRGATLRVKRGSIFSPLKALLEMLDRAANSVSKSEIVSNIVAFIFLNLLIAAGFYAYYYGLPFIAGLVGRIMIGEEIEKLHGFWGAIKVWFIMTVTILLLGVIIALPHLYRIIKSKFTA